MSALAMSLLLVSRSSGEDHLRKIQQRAFDDSFAAWGHWGADPANFTSWKNHSNRLIPIYTFGLTLDDFAGKQSIYRVGPGIKKLYGRIPAETLNPQADYLDQTDIWHLQMRAIEELNKRYVFLIVFDGMDWVTTRMATVARLRKVAYDSGRGTGLWFQDYRGVATDFSFMVTSAHNKGTKVDVDTQRVRNPGGTRGGGFSALRAGTTPWSEPTTAIADWHKYMINKSDLLQHVVTDSAASATSMTCGIKTYNGSVNVAPDGRQAVPIARWLQANRDFPIGVVTSVPISHATPSAAYANNVERNDYQDLSRDLLGLPSISHAEPLPGVDVLIGCGWGVEKEDDALQGANFVAGNRYLTADDLAAADIEQGGSYVVAQCTPGRPGSVVLSRAVKRAIKQDARLLGFFGCDDGHLPYQTADGDFNPVREQYSREAIHESPRLAEMTEAAIEVLDSKSDRFWLMVEAGDVDWASHSNNLDDTIGAIFDGEAAVRAVTDWIEKKDLWDDAAMIVTADHGHYFVLNDPLALVASANGAATKEEESAVDEEVAVPGN